MEQQAGLAGRSGSRRRRRSQGAKAKTRFWNHPKARRTVTALVLLLLLADLLTTWVVLRRARAMYGDFAIGQSTDDLLYAMGAPTLVSDAAGTLRPPPSPQAMRAADSWVYRRAGSVMRAQFEGGRLAHATCSLEGDNAASSFCPATLGVSMGTDEGMLWYDLGAPDSQRYVGDTKLMRYDGIGLTFGLRRFQVVSIGYHRASGNAAAIAQWVRALVP